MYSNHLKLGGSQGVGVILCLLAMIGASLFSVPARAEREQARSADAFVNSIGICTHITTVWGPYCTASFSSLSSALGELGVRHIRADVHSGSLYPSRNNSLYNAYGIQSVMIVHRYLELSLQEQAAIAANNASIEWMEGINEPDNVTSTTYTYSSLAGSVYSDAVASLGFSATGAIQNDFDTILNGAKPLLSPALASPTRQGYLLPCRSYDMVAVHTYPGGRIPTGFGLTNTYWQCASKLFPVDGTLPVVATETGYHTATLYTGSDQAYVSETAQGKYIPRLLAEYFNMGFARTYTYELMDSCNSSGVTDLSDKEQNFGIVRLDFSRKPAFIAERNLISLLKEASWNSSTKQWIGLPVNFTPGTLDYTLTGTTGLIHHTLLQKTDGTFYLLIWQDVPVFDIFSTHTDIANATVPVTLNLNTPIKQIDLYQPNQSTDSLQTYTGTNSVTLNVPDQVLIVKLTPKSIPASWSNADIGTVPTAGNTVCTSNSWLVSGSGSDIGSTTDSGQFAYQTLKGNGTFIARVASMPTTYDASKAGIMIRQDLTSNSAYAGLFVTPGRGLNFQYRTASGRSSSGVTQTGITAPYWMKLVRTGNSLSGFISANGSTWTQLGTAQTVTMSSAVYVGMAVCSRTTPTITATIDSVSQSYPTVSIQATTPTAKESPVTNGVFTVTRVSSSTASALTVNYTVGGSATNGTDYTSLSGSVTIPAGQTTASLTVIPVNDTTVEPAETVQIQLAASDLYNIGSPASDTVTILSDDVIDDFESGSLTNWSFKNPTTSTLSIETVNVDTGAKSLKWTYTDDGVNSYTNNIYRNFSTAQDWSKSNKVVIRLAESASNPVSDVHEGIYLDLYNNGTRVTGGWSVDYVWFNGTTTYRTVEFDLSTYPRDKITRFELYVMGNRLSTGTHTWYIDNISVK